MMLSLFPVSALAEDAGEPAAAETGTGEPAVNVPGEYGYVSEGDSGSGISSGSPAGTTEGGTGTITGGEGTGTEPVISGLSVDVTQVTELPAYVGFTMTATPSAGATLQSGNVKLAKPDGTFRSVYMYPANGNLCGTLALDESFPAGTYEVTELTCTDSSNKTCTLDGTALQSLSAISFEVIKAPLVEWSLSNVSISKTPCTYGDTLTLSLQSAGPELKSLRATFVLGIYSDYLQLDMTDKGNGAWEVSFPMGLSRLMGEWNLLCLTGSDGSNLYSVYNTAAPESLLGDNLLDLSAADFTLQGPVPDFPYALTDLSVSSTEYVSGESIELGFRLPGVPENTAVVISLHNAEANGWVTVPMSTGTQPGSYIMTYPVEYMALGGWSISGITFSVGPDAFSITNYGTGEATPTCIDMDLSAADFTVAATHTEKDTTPPVIEDLSIGEMKKVLYVSIYSISYPFTLTASDEGSGLQSGTVKVACPDGSYETVSLSLSNGTLTGEFDIYDYTPGGDYQVAEITCTDVAGNTATLSGDALASLTSTAFHCPKPAWTLSNLGISKANCTYGDTLTLRVHSEGPVSNLWARFVLGVNEDDIYVYLEDKGNGNWEGSFPISVSRKMGDWKLHWISGCGEDFDYMILNSGAPASITYNPTQDLSAADFTLVGPVPDFPYSLTDLSISSKQYGSGESLELGFRLPGVPADTLVSISLRNEDANKWVTVPMVLAEDGRYVLTYSVASMALGGWRIYGISFSAGADTFSITNNGTGEATPTCIDMDLSAADFQVVYGYIVRFHGNGADGGAMADLRVTEGEAVPVPGCAFTRTGYGFDSWNTEPDGSGEEWVTGSSLPGSNDGPLDLYATWTALRYDISYYSGSEQLTLSPDWYTIPGLADLPVPEKTGFLFQGWYKDSALKEPMPVIPAGTTGELTLYAKWKADPAYAGHTYTVEFSPAGAQGTMTAQTMRFNVATALKANAFKLPGHTFAGWAPDPYGEPVFTNKQKVNNLDLDLGMDPVVLYPVWKANRFTAAFSGNGGTLVSNGKTVKTVSVAGIYGDGLLDVEPEFTRPGYEFAGWARSSKAKVPEIVDFAYLTATNNGKVTLYAVWTPITYFISYELDGGENNPANPEEYNTAKAAALKAPTRPGYTFAGWYDDATGKKLSSVAKGRIGDVSLTARWTPNTYKVKFAANGGKGVAPAVQSGYADEILVTVQENTFTFAGRTFVGWNTAANGSGTAYAPGEEAAFVCKNKGTVTLYAMWDYDVTLDPNGGEGSPETITLRYNAPEPLPGTSFAKEGYTLSGWSTTPGGKVKYKPGASVKNLAAGQTLYAVWKGSPYSVQFDANGGRGTMKKLSTTNGKLTTLKANAFKMTGYRFIGWAVEPEGPVTFANKAKVLDLDLALGEDPAILYAVWEPNA